MNDQNWKKKWNFGKTNNSGWSKLESSGLRSLLATLQNLTINNLYHKAEL